MSDENLTQYLKKLEEKIGAERLRVLRQEAVRRGVSIDRILSDAILEYTRAIEKTEEAA